LQFADLKKKFPSQPMAKSHPRTVSDENAHNLDLLGQENATVKKAVSPFFMKPAQSFISTNKK
jgi:hypothetical protein